MCLVALYVFNMFLRSLDQDATPNKRCVVCVFMIAIFKLLQLVQVSAPQQCSGFSRNTTTLPITSKLISSSPPITDNNASCSNTPPASNPTNNKPLTSDSYSPLPNSQSSQHTIPSHSNALKSMSNCCV